MLLIQLKDFPSVEFFEPKSCWRIKSWNFFISLNHQWNVRASQCVAEIFCILHNLAYYNIVGEGRCLGNESENEKFLKLHSAKVTDDLRCSKRKSFLVREIPMHVLLMSKYLKTWFRSLNIRNGKEMLFQFKMKKKREDCEFCEMSKQAEVDSQSNEKLN